MVNRSVIFNTYTLDNDERAWNEDFLRGNSEQAKTERREAFATMLAFLRPTLNIKADDDDDKERPDDVVFEAITEAKQLYGEYAFYGRGSADRYQASAGLKHLLTKAADILDKRGAPEGSAEKTEIDNLRASAFNVASHLEKENSATSADDNNSWCWRKQRAVSVRLILYATICDFRGST